MGACLSSGGVEVTDEEKRMHREVEKQMREVSLLIVIAPCNLNDSIGESQDGFTSQGVCFVSFRLSIFYVVPRFYFWDLAIRENPRS